MGQDAGNSDVGVYAYDCENYRVEGVYTESFGLAGFYLRALNDSTMTTYRKRGLLSDCSAHACKTGFKIGARAEYNYLANCRATNCTNSSNSDAGFVIVGGNNFFSNCSAAECKNGVIVDIGSNGQHGSWVGGNVNHCSNIGVWCKGSQGFTFSGLHNYLTAYAVYFDACEGFQFIGGHIVGSPGTTIFKSASALLGPNLFSGVYLANVTIASSISGDATARSLTRFYDCTDGNNSPSPLNEFNASPSAVTIASGSVLRIGGFLTIDTESAASTDDLTSITAGSAGAMVVVRAANDARSVVVKHGTGNIRLAGSADFTLDNSLDRLTLQFDGTNWIEVARSDNGV
jgi:hypothetical protein